MDNNDELLFIQQQGITNKAESVFILDANTDRTINLLSKNSNLKLSGIFKPKVAGKYVLEASFKYEEGEPVTTAAEITVIKATLLPIIYSGLDDKVVASSLHEVELLVKNADDFTATVVNIEAGNLLPETIIIELKKKKYSLEAFNNLPNSEKKLVKSDQIKIKGTYKAKDTAGADSLGIKVNYQVDESTENVKLSFDAVDGGSTNVIAKEDANVRVTATVNPTQKKMRLNSQETIEFIFENTSDHYPATGVEITITSTDPNEKKN